MVIFIKDKIVKYSIIIPTLNEEKLLPNLLSQLTKDKLMEEYNCEIIVSDGGSKDNTVGIAVTHSDTVKVHSLQTKQNIAAGRNEGARYANGEILIFINGDILFKNVSSFFDFLNKKFLLSKYSAMTCKVKVFPDEEKFSDKLFHSIYNTYFRLLNDFGLGMGRGECQVVRKNVFQDVGGYNESLAAGEDFDLFRRIRKTGKIFYANDMCIYESPRRYRKIGYNGVSWSWLVNGISVLFKNKSISKEWEQVR